MIINESYFPWSYLKKINVLKAKVSMDFEKYE